MRYPLNANSRYFVQGVLDLLDEPGEFHFDSSTGDLYYWAMDGDIASQTIIAPKVKQIISVKGASESNRAHDIRFEVLAFEYTEFTDWFRHAYPADGDSGEGHTFPQYDRQINMSQHRTGTFFMENTNNITVKNSHFKNTGYSAIYMLFYNQNNTVYGNWIEHVGFAGVFLEGNYPGEGDVTKNNLISNNKIHNIGELVGHASGVYLMNSSSNEVSYSEIVNSPRYAVAWDAYVDIPNSNTNVYAKNNTIKYLKIKNVAQDSGDTAPLYAWGLSDDAPYLSNTVEQVTIDNVHAHPSMADYAPNGIFMDNDANAQIFKNVEVTNTQSSPFRNNNSGSNDLTNVSWVSGFNNALMEYTSIGLKSDFPSEYADGGGSSSTDFVFTDDFENGLLNWSAGKGTATTDNTQSFSGSYSYVTNEDTDVLYKALGANYNSAPIIRFYDDATDTSVKSMVRVDSGAWNDGSSWRGIGVDTSRSESKYVTRVGGTYTVSTVDRTTGWHELKWDYTSGNKVDLYIDDVLIASATGVTSFSNIAMGDWWSGGGSGTNYFDMVEVPVSYSDGFENGLTQWSAAKGNPSVSTVQAHSGDNSFVINEDIDVIYNNLGLNYNTLASIWFYDDASDTSVRTMARVDSGLWDDGTTWRGIGVDTSHSTSNYVVRVNGTYTVTTVSRSTGWHELKWDYSDGVAVKMYIDDILVASPTGVTSFSQISFGDWWQNNSFGTSYFDDIQVH